MIARIFGAEEILPLDWQPYTELSAANEEARQHEIDERNRDNLRRYNLKAGFPALHRAIAVMLKKHNHPKEQA